MTKKATLKRILLVAFIMTAIVTLFTLTTAAETEGYYTYSVSNGEVTITDVDTSISGDVSIPSTLGGYPVTSIGDNAFIDHIGLTSVTIPDSVKSIGRNSFYNCNNLTSITIGNSVTSIGDYAFWDCLRLAEVINKSSLDIVKGSSNNGHIARKSIEVHDGNSKIVNKGGYLFYTYADINYLLGYLNSDTKLMLPENYNGQNYEINQHAFQYCTNITSVDIPNGVTVIGGWAFDDCTGLTSVTIPHSVTSIGDYAFYNCTALEKIQFHATAMDDLNSSNHVFHKAGQNGNGIEVVIGKNVTKIPANLFRPYNDSYYPPKITSVDFEEGSVCTNIGSYAFYHCTNLTSVTIPDSVISIGSYAFAECYMLNYNIYDNAMYLGNKQNPYIYLAQSTNLVFNNDYIDDCEIYDGTRFIGDYAFRGCLSLGSVTIPDSVISIGDYAFYICDNLDRVTIPASVTSLGYGMFTLCDNLKSIIFEDTSSWYRTTSLLSWQNMTGGTETDVTDSSTNAEYFKNTYCNNYWYFVDSASQGLEFTSNGDGTCYVSGLGTCPDTAVVIPEISPNGDKVTSIGAFAFENCDNLVSVTIPDSATSIEIMAFHGCNLLTNLEIGESVTNIGGLAFDACANLTSVTIPDSVTNIGDYAFSFCNSLTSVTIGDNVTSIGSGAFAECNNLQYNIYDNAKYLGNEQNPYICLAYSVNSDITECEIHENTKLIAGQAFYGCDSLTSVTIPNSVTSIGNKAFRNCTNLASVTFLSPTTTINSSSSTIPTTTTIYGFAGSTAEAYATEYSRTFVSFASDLTTVFEFDATFEANYENAGFYFPVATLNRKEIYNSSIALDFLYAEGASGALYIKDTDGAYQPLYGSDGNALVLGEKETDIAVVYDNKNGLVRYYINNSLPRYGEGKALAYDLPISDDFTKSHVISDTLTTLDGVDFTNAFTINESGTAEIVALQDNLENNSSMRLLAGVDMLYYGAVGFETELYIDGVAQNKTSEQSGLVYSSVIAGTETVLPSAYGFRYFATLTIDGVDLSEYNGMTVHLIIKPYTQVGTTKYYGSAAKVDITDNGDTYSYTFDESYVDNYLKDAAMAKIFAKAINDKIDYLVEGVELYTLSSNKAFVELEGEYKVLESAETLKSGNRTFTKADNVYVAVDDIDWNVEGETNRDSLDNYMKAISANESTQTIKSFLYMYPDFEYLLDLDAFKNAKETMDTRLTSLFNLANQFVEEVKAIEFVRLDNAVFFVDINGNMKYDAGEERNHTPKYLVSLVDKVDVDVAMETFNKWSTEGGNLNQTIFTNYIDDNDIVYDDVFTIAEYANFNYATEMIHTLKAEIDALTKEANNFVTVLNNIKAVNAYSRFTVSLTNNTLDGETRLNRLAITRFTKSTAESTTQWDGTYTYVTANGISKNVIAIESSISDSAAATQLDLAITKRDLLKKAVEYYNAFANVHVEYIPDANNNYNDVSTDYYQITDYVPYAVVESSLNDFAPFELLAVKGRLLSIVSGSNSYQAAFREKIVSAESIEIIEKCIITYLSVDGFDVQITPAQFDGVSTYDFNSLNAFLAKTPYADT